MSEENRKPGMEISEQSLEQVSGGNEELLAKAKSIAKNACTECRRDAVQSCSAGSSNVELLTNWLYNHEYRLIWDYLNYSQCPYARGQRG